MMMGNRIWNARNCRPHPTAGGGPHVVHGWQVAVCKGHGAAHALDALADEPRHAAWGQHSSDR